VWSRGLYFLLSRILNNAIEVTHGVGSMVSFLNYICLQLAPTLNSITSARKVSGLRTLISSPTHS
jgi:hypothetical protein